MGKYFSDVVEQAISDLYYCYDIERAKAAAEALFHAAKERQDGDACYLLSRCFSGPDFSNWRRHPFQENKAAAYAMLREAVARGSAIGVLGAIRIGMLTPEFQELMPFATTKEAWDEVRRKAENGCLFCQYMLANTYYYLDIIEIEDRRESDFPSRSAWLDWQRQQIEKSIPLFENAFAGGMGIAGRNLNRFYQYGRGSLIAPQPEKTVELSRKGAEWGYPDWMYSYAWHLYYKADRKEEGLILAQKAAAMGDIEAWSIIGDAYLTGSAVETSMKRALECYEKGAAGGKNVYCCYRAGEMYFLGSGAPQDYARAVQYLEASYIASDYKSQDTHLLGICYLMGYGCRQNTALGKSLLERSRSSRYKNYGLGIMYAEGIGVPEDIERGVGYLKAAGNYKPALDALKNYKKSFFGTWRRR